MAWWKGRTRGPDAAALTTWTPEGGSLARCSALGARAPRADLRGIDLSSANLTHSSLQRSRLEWAMLQSTALNHANLRRANLRWAMLHRAELVGTDLRKADLTAADLSGGRSAALSAPSCGHPKRQQHAPKRCCHRDG